MKAGVLVILFTLFCPLLLPGRPNEGPETNSMAGASGKLLGRHYQDGQRLSYHMKATNKGKTETETYEVDVNGTVKKDAAGNFYEEYQWTNLVLNGKRVPLPATSENYRQELSLDPKFELPAPKIDPMLVGPILDLLTFYADLRLATQSGNLARPGDHFYIKYGKPASWANGAVILGEDSVDFDITLKEIDSARQMATVVVRHVSPAKPEIKIPADWMRASITNGPNNWVQVTKAGDKYIAVAGVETFDCEIKVSLSDGKILSAKMDNPVQVMERECADKTLADCGPPVCYEIHRQIEIY